MSSMTRCSSPCHAHSPRQQGLRGEVTLIFQHFGNVITNIHRDDLDDWHR